MSTDERRPYHHGDLRRVLLETAVEVIAEHGPGAVTLRDLARRAGVSHAAPTHHYRDRTGLLTAVAAQGYELLGDALSDAAERGGFAEVGVAYVLFAASHPGHFSVMFRPDLSRPDDEALVAARARTTALLRGGAAASSGSSDRVPALAAWSLVHGLATLVRDGAVAPDPGSDLETLARAVAGHLSLRAAPDRASSA